MLEELLLVVVDVGGRGKGKRGRQSESSGRRRLICRRSRTRAMCSGHNGEFQEANSAVCNFLGGSPVLSKCAISSSSRVL